MRNDEEEHWIQSIRVGTIKYENISIVPATIDQVSDAANVYRRSYDESLNSGIMTDSGLEHWMIENSLLPKSFHTSRENLNKSIDNLKKRLFRNRSSKSAIKSISAELTNTRAKLKDLLAPKSHMSNNTCEFIAQTEKLVSLLHATTFKNNKPYKPANMNVVIEIWQESLASESLIRSLARCDTWRSIWANKGFGFKLFKKNNPDDDLTINQRNLITWSRVYDNIQESIDCPSDAAIANHDMLDGWFLIQQAKREKERMEQEAEALTGDRGKSANAQHVFVPQGADNIDINILNEGHESKPIHNIIEDHNK